MDEQRVVAVDLARHAGNSIRSHFSFGIKKEWKEDHSPVTEADKKINAMVLECLRSNYPDDDIIAEEGSDRREGAEYAWVCDPLDGTIPFSHGVPLATFSLARLHNGAPILGVVYDPFMDRMIVAEKGKGAYLNGAPVHVSLSSRLEDGLFNLELPKGRIQYDISGVRESMRTERAKCLTFAAVCYGGLLIACGEFLGTIFANPTCHDGAALKIIIEEAGGKMTDILGNEQRYDRPILGFVASNGLVHDELLRMIRGAINQSEQ